MNSALRRIRSLASRGRSEAQRRLSTVAPLPPDHNPVFILGHQKAGTSAIAGLLGQHTGLPVTIDLKQEIRDLIIPRIVEGKATIDQLIDRNRDAFAVPIVKHPNLTLIYPVVRQRFPSSKFVFVVRDPRDNFRSIFDRLGLSGTEAEIGEAEWEALPRPWRLILGEGRPGWDRSSHLDALSDRWTDMVDTYESAADTMILVRYEDFAAAKESTIGDLASQLGLPGSDDIGDSVDRPFQRQGANRHTHFADFFSADNLSRIEKGCTPHMQRLGYQPWGGSDV